MTKRPDPKVIEYQERLRRLWVEYRDLKEPQEKRELTGAGKDGNVTHILFRKREL